MTTPNTATPLTSTGLPPILLSATPSGVAGSMSIDLEFNTAMAAGSGTIYITDGAVQTVIDRATGQPAMRVTGATDTHTLSAADVDIDGAHVRLNVAGLLPGHSYSVVMGAGVLVSSDHLAFGGVRGASQVQFATPPAPDTGAPSLVSIGADGSMLKAGGSIGITLKFSEAIKALPDDAFASPNASLTGLASIDGITWYATLKAPAGAVSASVNLLTLDMSKVQDLAGNAGSGTTQVASYAVDTQAPTASINLDHTVLGGGQNIVATLAFSESVKGLDIGALSAGHASLSNLHTVDDGRTWQVTLTGAAATTSSADTLSLDMSKLTDLAGNAGSGVLKSDGYTVDTQGPAGVSVTLGATTLKAGATTGVTFKFSEAVQDFGNAISAPHASISGLATSDGGKTWTGLLSAAGPNTSSGNVVSVGLSKVLDLAGNAGSGSIASGAYTVDTVAPSVASIQLDAGTVSSGHGVGVTITFSEAIKALDAGAITAPHANLNGLHSTDGGTTWVATLNAPASSATSSGNQLAIDLGKVLDLAGNAGSGVATSGAYAVDTEGPGATLALSGTPLRMGGSATLTIDFEEAVTDLTVGAIGAPNTVVGNLQHSDDYRTWTAILRPADGITDATNVVSLDLGKVHDAAGNAGSGAATSVNYVVDTIAPVGVGILLGGTALTAANGMSVSFSFSEKVADPSAAITAPGAVVENLHTDDGGLTWAGSMRAAPGAFLGSSVVQVDMTKVHDLNGNAGSGALSSKTSYTVDSQGPQAVSIALSGSDITQTAGIGFTIKFSEAVKDLNADAIQAPHASLVPLQHSDDYLTWTGTLTASDSASAPGNVLGVDLGKLHDAAGNAGSGVATSTAFYNANPASLDAAVTLSGSALQSGGSLQATIRFTSAVDTLDPAAFVAPHMTVGSLRHSDDKLTWTVSLTPADAGIDDGDARFGIDLTKVSDHWGIHGSGVANSPVFLYDTTLAAYVTAIDFLDRGVSGSDGITSMRQPAFSVDFAGTPDSAHQNVLFTVDGTPHMGINGSAGDPSWRLYSEDTLAGGLHTVTATLVDDQGHASATFTRQFTVDNDAPVLLDSNDVDSFDASSDLVLHFSEAVYWSGGESSMGGGLQIHNNADGDVWQADRSIALTDAHFSPDHKTLLIHAGELNLATGNDYSLQLPETLIDLAGNVVSNPDISLHTAGPHVDVTPPQAIVAQVLANAHDSFGAGAAIEIDIRFSEAVQLAGNGAPVVHLNSGGQATFARLADDGKTMVFTYTVGPGQETDGLNLSDPSDLLGHVADLHGNLLDQAHVSYMGFPHFGLAPLDGDGSSIRIRTGLDAPQLADTSDTGTKGDGITRVAQPDFVGHADSYAIVNLYSGDHLIGSTAADAAGNWEIDDVLLGAGAMSISMRETDMTGAIRASSKALSLTITPDAPASATLAADSDGGIKGDDLTNATTPTLTGSVAAGTKVDVFDGSTLLGHADVSGSGVWTFAPLGNLAEGQHTITLQLSDAGGNVTPRALSTPYTFTIDATAPATPGTPALAAGSDSGTVGDNITNVNTPTLTGTANQAGDTIDVYDGAVRLGSAVVKDDKSWSFIVGSSSAPVAKLGDGVHTLTAQEVDAAGNHSAASGALTVTVDTVAPTITARATSVLGLINFYDLTFSEKVVFTKGELDVLDDSGHAHSQHTWNIKTNWDLLNDNANVQDVLHLNLGAFIGNAHLQMSDGAITDVAGNVAIIGSAPGPTSWMLPTAPA